MQQELKYNFTPANTYRRKHSSTFVTITHTGTIIFNRACVEKYDLANRRIRFYTDISKNALGWQIINTLNDFTDLKDKKYRTLKLSRYHTATLSIRNILREFNIQQLTLRKLKIFEYVDSLYNKIYYIILKK